jgi:hypothetical protein
MQVETDTLLPAGLPADWLLDVDLPCPTCHYNLRKLHKPRCPECGNPFRWQMLLHISCPRCAASLEVEDGERCPACGLTLDWARLLGERDPAEFKQFEYTLRPLRAALLTIPATLLPRRFWRGVRIESPPAIRRLRWYQACLWAVFLAGFLSLYSALTFSIFGRLTVREVAVEGVGWAAPAIFPIVTALLMPVFSPTLSKFRIRRDRLLRVFAYGTAGLAWLGLAYGSFAALSLALPAAASFWGWSGVPSPFFPNLLAAVGWVCSAGASWYGSWWMPVSVLAASISLLALILLFGLVWWWRFAFVALRDHLRLARRDVWALFISTQVIAMLTAAIFVLVLGGDDWVRFVGSFLF